MVAATRRTVLRELYLLGAGRAQFSPKKGVSQAEKRTRPITPLAQWRSPGPATTEKVHDREQDDGNDERDVNDIILKSLPLMEPVPNSGAITSRREKPHDADHDVSKQALLRFGFMTILASQPMTPPTTINRTKLEAFSLLLMTMRWTECVWQGKKV